MEIKHGSWAGYGSGCRCEACVDFKRAYHRAWEAKPENRAKARAKRLRRFGLTPERYDVILESQGGVCAICKRPEMEGRSLSVDHDHSCCSGKLRSCGRCVRGLLCGDCNAAIGKLGDSVEGLMRAIDYLKRAVVV